VLDSYALFGGDGAKVRHFAWVMHTSPLEVVVKRVGGTLVFSSQKAPDEKRISHNTPVAKRVELATGGDDVGIAQRGERSLYPFPVRLQTSGKVDVLSANQVFVEASDRFKIFPAAPKQATGELANHQEKVEEQESRFNAGRRPVWTNKGSASHRRPRRQRSVNRDQRTWAHRAVCVNCHQHPARSRTGTRVADSCQIPGIFPNCSCTEAVRDFFGFIGTAVQNDDYFQLVAIRRPGNPNRFQASTDEAFFVPSRDYDGEPR